MLKLSSVVLRLDFRSQVRLPRWLGSAFRGGLGQHLRRLVCYHPLRECEGCEHASECLFYAVYQNPSARRGHAPPPRPIILVPPFFGKEMRIESGAWLELRLLMFGEYVRYFPHVILALQQLGSQGLGDARYLGQNRFEVTSGRCEFSGETVYDGGTIYPRNLRVVDVRELPPVEHARLRVGFRTPIQLPRGFPPPPEHLLKLIRQRLILLVNQYGDGGRVPEPVIRGKVSTVARHYHRLPGCSSRSGRREFWHCWTGIANYELEEIDETGRWLLGVGKVLGAGAKSSFGLGFMDISPR